MIGPTLLTVAYLNDNDPKTPPMVMATNRQMKRKEAKKWLTALIVIWLMCIGLFLWTMVISFTCPTSYRILNPIIAFFFPVPYFIGAKLYGC